MNADEQATVELAALIQVPGALKIVTNERSAIPVEAAGARYSNPLADPAMWVQHDAVRLEPRERGVLRVYSAEGDWCEGRPEALLRRLREWRE